MITWLVGENSFEIREALNDIQANFSGDPERIDGSELTLDKLPDLLMGISLFATERLVIINNISQNSFMWEKLPEWLPRVSDDIHIVFIDAKPDKRTSSYKALKSVSQMHDFPAWTDRDEGKATRWVSDRAKKLDLNLSPNLAGHLVRRVGVDQWQLANAINTLSLLDEVTVDAIDQVVSGNTSENIFELFETALEGKADRISEKLKTLEQTEDPYAIFALLSSQALTLAAVTYASEDDNPLKDFAIHPFVASKLTRHGKKLGKGKAGKVLELFSKTDNEMKRSKAEPWLLVERLLLKITQIV